MFWISVHLFLSFFIIGARLSVDSQSDNYAGHRIYSVLVIVFVKIM